MNEVARGAYIKDCELGLKRWNMAIKRAGHDFQPQRCRRRGSVARSARGRTCRPRPTGSRFRREEFTQRVPEWLPTESDRAFVRSLMQRVVAPGKMAAWIAPPDRGINSLPVEYEYVKLT